MSTTHEPESRRQPAVHDRHLRLLPAVRSLLELSVRHLAPLVCVVRVEGELDMLTAPLLDACLRTQLSHGLPHLVVDLQGVNYLGPTGLFSLLRAHELTRRARVGFYLVGLTTRATGRSLAVTALLPMLRCYPTLIQLLSELRDRPGPR